MSFRFVRILFFAPLCLFLLMRFDLRVFAQAPASGQAGGSGGTLSGVVTDPSGAVIAKTSVRLTDARGASYDATTNKEGIYEFKGLVPGKYTL
ncbi:MAG TPA: carboxypeptidase-like regulatory domain-containing protein, partial [Candidatus Acidoferrum sp.]|nr:carboxypeptidase-like regulatory domain-containing protein [Candidatus Acidoferrum sp.]